MPIAALAPTTLDALLKDHPHLPGLAFAAVCLLILLVVAAPRLASWRRGKHRPVMDPLQVEELLMGSGVLVVDIRDPQTFRTGHIRGCLHVPFEELPARFAKPDPKANRPLVLVDETDESSHRAFDLLNARGFTWIYVMSGGMKAWRRANRPLVK